MCVAVMRLHKPCCSDVNAGELEIIEQKFKSFSISGGFRGYAGYAAAYPIDWTGCIFVTFKFCPIV